MKKSFYIITLLLLIVITSCGDKNYAKLFEISSFEIVEQTYNNEYVKDDTIKLQITINNEDSVVKGIDSIKLNDIVYKKENFIIEELNTDFIIKITAKVYEQDNLYINNIIFKDSKSKSRNASYSTDKHVVTFVKKDFKITFYHNNEGGLTFERRFNLNETAKLEKIENEDSFFEFKSWNSLASGSGRSFEADVDFSFTSTISNLYAVWVTTVYYYKGDLEFNEIDGGYEVFTDNADLSGEIVIPKIYNSKPVIKVADSGFADCKKITKVTLPEGLIEIGREAFKNDSGIESINLPSTLEIVGSNAFEGTTQIKKITFNNDLAYVGSNAFDRWTESQTIVVNNVEVFERFDPYWVSDCLATVFTNQSGDISSFNYILSNDSQSYQIVTHNVLKGDVVIPSTYKGLPVSYIKASAINNAKEMKTLTISENIFIIEPNNFVNCENLKKFIVDDNNRYFEAYLDNLYSNQFDMIYKAAPKNPNNTSEGFLHENVTQIFDYAFSDCTFIKEIHLNSSFEYVGEYAFKSWGSTQIVRIEGYAATPNNWNPNWSAGTNARIRWDYSVENPEFIFILQDNYYIITGININYLNLTSTDVLTIPSIHNGLEVRKIANEAILDFVALKTLVIPSSIRSIEYGAIMNCKNLMEIVVAEDNQYYRSVNNNLYTKNLNELIMYAPRNPNSFVIEPETRIIGSYAFNACQSMLLTIPKTVDYILDSAFYFLLSNQTILFLGRYEAPSTFSFGWLYNCNSTVIYQIPTPTLIYELSSTADYYIVVSAQIHDYSNLVIADTYNGLPVKEIKANAFNGDNAISSVTIGENIVKIGDNAFNNCSKLIKIEFKNNCQLEEIGQNVFVNCPKLLAVTMPNSLTKIGSNSFSNIGATIILFNDNLLTLEPGVFSGLKDLVSIIVPTDNPSFASEADVLYSKNFDTLILYPAAKNLANFVSLSQTRIIKNNAFDTALKLQDIFLTNVEVIEKEAFINCINLSRLTLNEGLLTIESRAFENCQNITKLVLPSSLENLEEYAFVSWVNFQEIVVNKSLAEANNKFNINWNNYCDAVLTYLE